MALLRGFGPTVSSRLYPNRKCPPSGPPTRPLGGGLERPKHGPSATSTVDRSAIRNTAGSQKFVRHIPVVMGDRANFDGY